jgi:flagellar protein FlgJ
MMDIAQLAVQSPIDRQSEALAEARELKASQTVLSGRKDEELKAVARQFESIFINQVLKQMQETIQESSFDPEDSSNEQVHGMYCTFLADAVSERGGVGLWEKIYEQLKNSQTPDVPVETPGTLDASV